MKANTEIKVVAIIFFKILGLSGAELAWPNIGFFGGALPKGRAIKNIHHQSNIYTTTDDTTSMQLTFQATQQYVLHEREPWALYETEIL